MVQRLLPALLALAGLSLLAASAGAGPDESHGATTLAVFGDTPYGDVQNANFPADVAEINADPGVRRVVHLGDIKSGSSKCTDEYFATVRSEFDGFDDPLVYTPGDNEWTDCHRKGDDPVERLGRVREVFFDRPGQTLGQHARKVDAQSSPFVENVSWTEAHTVFGTLNVPGSNNDLCPWGQAKCDMSQPAISDRQREEYETRLAADLAWIDHIFDAAAEQRAAGVVLALQADLWDPEILAAGKDQWQGYTPLVRRFAERARAFGRPVLLLEGDSHKFKVDNPLDGVAASPYGSVTVPRLTRIVVQGEFSEPHEWLRLHVDPKDPAVFSWRNIPFSSPAS